MTPVNRESLELEIGVFAGLVADLDESDQNVLDVLRNILERMSTSGSLPASVQSLFGVAKAEVDDTVSSGAPFDAAYATLCRVAEESQKWLRSLDADGPGTGSWSGSGSGTGSEAEPGSGYGNGTMPARRDGGTPGGTEQATPEDIAAFLPEGRDYLDSAELSLVDLEKDPSDREKVNEVFRCFHNLKGAAGFLSLTDVQSLAHRTESLMEGVRSGGIAMTGRVAECGFRAVDLLRKSLAAVEAALAGAAYVPPEGLESLSQAVDALVAGNSGSNGEQPPVGTVKTTSGETVKPSTAAAKAEELVRVSTSRLDSLVDAVGELVIANSMVSQEVQELAQANPLLTRNMDRMNKIIRELQELATGVRMVTLEGTFRKMARVVRDIASRSGALVDFQISGGETEIDRNMVEEMSSPLTHLIRNAVDHGLELPEERTRLGKPEKGVVRLSAFHQGGNVVIRVEDDGKGLDRQKILDKAVSQGLIKPGSDIPDREVYQLIYLPGFSTADKVTEVSGRGVGMDVVKRSVEALHGRIDISTAPGQGTSFIIRLPLTMAIIEGMVVSVATHRYIIPVSAIQESLRPSPDQLFSVAGRGELLLLRGNLVPLVRLHHVFRLNGAREDPCSALVIIISESGQSCALLADDLIGQQQVVVKPLDGIFRRVEALSGAAIVGDGTVSLILDPAGLIQVSKGA